MLSCSGTPATSTAITGWCRGIDHGRRRAGEDLRFSDIPRAVDTDFLNRAWAYGVKTYSSDRFNFVSIRGIDHEAHTWKVTDTELMIGGAQVAFYGDPRAHVDV